MLGGGPQSDREGRGGGLANGSGLKMDRTAEKTAYEGEVVRLRRENDSFRDQLRRSLVELRSYQLKYPTANVVYDDQELENLPPWATSPEVVSPLMQAYDERVKELENVVGQQTGQLDVFQQKLESLVAENDTLRNMQLDQLKNSGSGTSGGFGFGMSAMESVGAETLLELNERIDILMAENAVMVEQKTTLSTELDTYQEELTQRTEELTVTTERLNAALVDLRMSNEHSTNAEKNLEEASGRIMSNNDYVGKLESEREDLQEQVEGLKHKNASLDASLREMRSSMKDHMARTDEDATTFVNRTKAAEDRVRELHTLLLKKNQELDTVSEAQRKMRMDYQSTRQDAEGMLQVMGGLERQLAEYVSREEEVNKVVRVSKDKTEAALIERDQALAREGQAQAEISRLMAERKVAHETRQTLVDQELERARDRMMIQLKSTEADLDEIVQRHAGSKANEEKAVRDMWSATERLEKVERLRDEQKIGYGRAIRELEEKMKSVATSQEEEQRRRIEVQDLNKDLRVMVDKLRSETESYRVKVSQRAATLETELSSLRANLRDAQREGLDASRRLITKDKEVDEVRMEMDSQIAAMDKRRQEEAALFRKRSNEVEIERRELTLAVTNEERRAQNLIDQLTQKTNATINRLQSEQHDFRDQITRQATKVRDLEGLLKDAENEKSLLVDLLEETKKMNKVMEDELSEAQGAVSDLTGQLISSSEARESATVRAMLGQFDEEGDEINV
jgi:myosin protein heavy chain